MTKTPSHLETLENARNTLNLLLALTIEETSARRRDDTLRADRCYHLRQSLLEALASQQASQNDQALIVEGQDPCDLAERLLATM